MNMWTNSNSHLLLVGKQNVTTALRYMLEVSYKLNIAYWRLTPVLPN